MRITRVVSVLIPMVPFALLVVSCVSHQQDEPAEAADVAPLSEPPLDERAGVDGEDLYVEEAQSELDAEENVGEVAQELPKFISCPKRMTAEECSKKCGNEHIKCVAHLPHPKKYRAGRGDLYACGSFRNSCTYYYEKTKDSCVFWKNSQTSAWCIYTGGRS